MVQGLVTKSAAPAFIPSTASAIEPQAVIRITGSSGRARADLAQQLQPLLAGGAAGEVHVLQHQVEAPGSRTQARAPPPASRAADAWVAVPLEQQPQRGAHRRVVVDDQDHRGAVTRSAGPRRAARGWPAARVERAEHGEQIDRPPWRDRDRAANTSRTRTKPISVEQRELDDQRPRPAGRPRLVSSEQLPEHLAVDGRRRRPRRAAGRSRGCAGARFCHSTPISPRATISSRKTATMPADDERRQRQPEVAPSRISRAA